ncbi:hypothetical protein MMC17_004636 [Xylographa soralifera]|nr:hypothetical protein [Xylographa soralifera]
MNVDTTYRARWARRLVREKIVAQANALAQRDDRPPHRPYDGAPAIPISDGHVTLDPLKLPKLPSRARPQAMYNLLADDKPQEWRVAIIGAGMAGLYLAMILDDLKVPGLKYDLVEASNRIGGRALTHYFSKTSHDYYDIGAMRFPKIPPMLPTFNLFNRLKIPTIKYYLNAASGATKCPSLFNDILYVTGDPISDVDIYRVSDRYGGSVPYKSVSKTVDGILNEVFGPFKEDLKTDFEAGFKKLRKNEDKYSTRGKLASLGYDYFTIQWLETNDTSTGLYDQAFTESIIDSFDFDYPIKDDPPKVTESVANGEKKPEDSVEWYCIDGGTSVLANKMYDSVQGFVETGKRVTKIGLDRTKESISNMYIEIAGEEQQRSYATVFNTTTLACLQRMDLRELELHPSQKDAIRCLNYDHSCKVAIKFKYPWWIKDCGISKGGVASTDLGLRTCVYPSYNLNDGESKPAILLCSYTWAQDASRIGSLIKDTTPEGEDELLKLLLEDLARLHARDINYEAIKKAYVTHHSFDWYKDPYTSGAFALFGPGQFENLYPFLQCPTADAKFHIVGEASSAHHAWISGALDSAARAVYYFLKKYHLTDYMKKLNRNWGPIPDVDDEADENEDESSPAEWQLFLAEREPKDKIRV